MNKGNRHILRAFGVLMSIFMLTTVLAKDLVKTQLVVNIPVQTDDTQDDSDQDQSFLSELSSDVVIPSHAFNFGSELELIPVPQVRLIIFEEMEFAVAKPFFKHTYFDQLFEHHIAINAP
jgi:hypothetical protein